eukprot:scaffold15442_cov179-Alexandrium_tamarense.AAC.1
MGSVKSPRFSVEEGIHSLMAPLPLLCLLGRKERRKFCLRLGTCFHVQETCIRLMDGSQSQERREMNIGRVQSKHSVGAPSRSYKKLKLFKSSSNAQADCSNSSS